MENALKSYTDKIKDHQNFSLPIGDKLKTTLNSECTVDGKFNILHIEWLIREAKPMLQRAYELEKDYQTLQLQATLTLVTLSDEEKILEAEQAKKNKLLEDIKNTLDHNINHHQKIADLQNEVRKLTDSLSNKEKGKRSQDLQYKVGYQPKPASHGRSWGNDDYVNYENSLKFTIEQRQKTTSETRQIQKLTANISKIANLNLKIINESQKSEKINEREQETKIEQLIKNSIKSRREVQLLDNNIGLIHRANQISRLLEQKASSAYHRLIHAASGIKYVFPNNNKLISHAGELQDCLKNKYTILPNLILWVSKLDDLLLETLQCDTEFNIAVSIKNLSNNFNEAINSNGRKCILFKIRKSDIPGNLGTSQKLRLRGVSVSVNTRLKEHKHHLWRCVLTPPDQNIDGVKLPSCRFGQVGEYLPQAGEDTFRGRTLFNIDPLLDQWELCVEDSAQGLKPNNVINDVILHLKVAYLAC